MIKAEIFEDKALLLDADGRVWQVNIGNDGQPEIRMLERVSHDTINRLMVPELARYVPRAATASGKYGLARGADGCALFLVHRDNSWKITTVWAGIVGENGVKANTWYALNEAGEIEEAS